MTAGRIESYIHSDSITSNKGGALVKVLCQTDFAARTEDFIRFTKKVARMVYAYGLGGATEDDVSITWEEFVAAAGDAGVDLDKERELLSTKLKETVTITDIVVLIL
jgi:translation elongation factor EF-Ts